MKPGGHLTNIAGHLTERMHRVAKHMEGMQETPVDTRKRGTREQKKVWETITGLDEQERNALLTAMGERAGHEENEKQPCELCRWVANMVGTDK